MGPGSNARPIAWQPNVETGADHPSAPLASVASSRSGFAPSNWTPATPLVSSENSTRLVDAPSPVALSVTDCPCATDAAEDDTCPINRFTVPRALSRPPVSTLPVRPATLSTPLSSASLTCWYVDAGRSPNASAATPLTYGVAIDVPLM